MMISEDLNYCNRRNRSGVVLLVTLVLLVMLSTLGYTLSSRVAARRHRDQYIIDYQAARYGCDSAVRYALAMLQDMNTPPLIARPNEPDFSDLFCKDDQQYEQYLTDWAAVEGFDSNRVAVDANDADNVNDVNSLAYNNSPNSLTVRGPYGPAWPLILEPVEFEVGSAAVTVQIEDENAKYPLGWMLLEDEDEDEEVQREALAGLETFCEWVDVNVAQIDSLRKQLEDIGEIKTFKLDFKPIEEKEEVKIPARRHGRRDRRVVRRRIRQKIIPASVHYADFAKLFHSSLIDTEALARPTIVSDTRKESALKYMGLWASNKVNINTAPRHVLEAAFAFGGDAAEIAQGIIRRRRIEPFTDIEDLRKSLFRYSASIEKCEKYITTSSDFFTIRITAVSGAAKASTVIAVTKRGEKLEKIASISG